MDKPTVKTFLKYIFYLIVSLEACAVCVLGIGAVIICTAGNAGIEELKNWASDKCFIAVYIGIAIVAIVAIVVLLGTIICCLCKCCKDSNHSG